MEDSLVEFNGMTFHYRQNTTDWGIIQEACGGLYTKYFDIEPEELWFDVGANIGAFTCYAASKGAIVSALEPFEDNFNLLISNIIENGFEDRVKAHMLAVSDKVEVIDLHIDTNNFGNCSKYARSLTKIVQVKSISSRAFNIFDDMCLKIDTEGCEYEILSELDLSRVKKLVLENHYWLQPQENTVGIIDLIHSNFNNVEEFGGYMIYAWN